MLGLNHDEVVESRIKYGSNVIVKKRKNSFLHLLIESLGDPIIKILLIALAIKVVVSLRNFDYFETIGILIAIFLASFISSISEYGSEKAFERLQEESLNGKCKVMRDGHLQEISVSDVVVGDLVVLYSGAKIPADGVVIKGEISVDESILNGESKETKKRLNDKVFKGCVIYEGDAYMKVTQVGDKTLMGKVSVELAEDTQESPLRLRLKTLAGIISKLGYIGAILASITFIFSKLVIDNNFDINLIIQDVTNFHLMFDYLLYALTLSVTIIVVAVPEGLPMMITLVLSSNMKRMMKDNVLVRKMVGIETSGSLNVLFTDKTGTLTKGHLRVSEIVTKDGLVIKDLNTLKMHPLYKHFYINFFYNSIESGNSTDKAFLDFIKEDSSIKLSNFHKFGFKNSEKSSKVVLEDFTVYIKGAPEVILPKCKGINETLIKQKISYYTKNSGRVIALAYGKNESNLNYLGFVNIKDELRTDARDAIKLIKKAGVLPIMITGDNIDTARSIAQEAGIIDHNQYLVLNSTDLARLSDDEIASRLKNIAVVSRVLPQDKSRLVKIAKSANLVVGMTGDGVNDAPALKTADVGFAVGSGTDIAKEAADIVILDNSILSIAKAILYGRTIFKSIRRFIIYQLTVNMCALILSILGSLIGVSTPITIVQMLWLNMIMDTFAGVAFSFESPLLEYMEEAPKKRDTPIMNKYMYNQIIVLSTYTALLCILFLKLPVFKSIVRSDPTDKYLMTAYFAMFIFMGIFNAFNSRTTRINIFSNLHKNKVFIIIFTFIFIVQIYIIYYGGTIFRTYGLTLKELILSFLLALTVIPVDMLRKYILKKKGKDVGV